MAQNNDFTCLVCFHSRKFNQSSVWLIKNMLYLVLQIACRAKEIWFVMPPNPQCLSGPLPRSLWRLGWWGRHSLVPRRCTPPHVHAPVAQPCTLWRPRPTRALFGHWSSWRSVCRPGWAAPYGPTPCGLWRSSHSNWYTENSIVRADAISQTEHHT